MPGSPGQAAHRLLTSVLASGPDRMSCAAPGAAKVSTRAASAASASRSRAGPDNSMVTVAASRPRSSRQRGAVEQQLAGEQRAVDGAQAQYLGRRHQ